MPGTNLPVIDPSNKQLAETCEFCSVAAGMGFYGKKADGLDLLYKLKINGVLITEAQGTAILNSGLPVKYESSLFNQFLTGNYDTDIMSATAAGYPVLASYNTGPHMGHEVMITRVSLFTDGITASLDYAFYNPATGGYGDRPVSNFNSDSYVIKGVR